MKIGDYMYDGHENVGLGKVFSWLARTGIGMHFGGSSIHHYQMVQMAAIDELRDRAFNRGAIGAPRQTFEVRVQQGDVQARAETARRWTLLGPVREVSRAAYDRSYRR